MKPTYEELLQENSELRRQLLKQEQRIAELEKIIEELRRGYRWNGEVFRPARVRVVK